jgi:hypothetical protein
METPVKEIKSLCAYVECDIQLGIQAAPEWAATLRKVLRWLEAAEQLAPDWATAALCPSCKSDFDTSHSICIGCGRPTDKA